MWFSVGPRILNTKLIPGIDVWEGPSDDCHGIELGPRFQTDNLLLWATKDRPPSEYDVIGKGRWEDVTPDPFARDALARCSGSQLQGDSLARLVLDGFTRAADPLGTDSCNPVSQNGTRLSVALAGQIFEVQGQPNSNLATRHQHEFRRTWEVDQRLARKQLGAWLLRYGFPWEQWRRFVPKDLRDAVREPLKPETTHTDDFSGTLAAWNDRGGAGTWSIVSNQLQCASPDTSELIYGTALSTDEQYSEVTLLTSASILDGGVITRHDNASYASSTRYLFVSQNFAAITRIYSAFGNGFTSIASTSTTIASGSVIYGESNSSDQHTLKDDGSILLGPTTDTTYTAQLYPGIRSGSGGSPTNPTYDDWTGADISAGSSVLPELYEQMPAQITPQPVVAVPY